MRTYAFITTFTALAVAACITLTGCTAGQAPTDEVDEITESDWQIHFNRDTGKITAIFDHESQDHEVYRDKAFNEEADLALPFWLGSDTYSGSNSVEGTLNIQGADYPVSLEISWSFGSTNWTEQARYYNAHIASPETIDVLASRTQDAFRLTQAVTEFVGEAVMASPMPTAQFITSGKATISYGADFLVQGYLNGVEPRDLVLQVTGYEPLPNEEYAFAFNCASYEITLANGDDIQSWIDQMPFNMDGVDIRYRFDADSAVVPTEEPCDIKQKSPITSENTEAPSGSTQGYVNDW